MHAKPSVGRCNALTYVYLSGIFPRSEELIEVTRAYDRRRTSRESVGKAQLDDARQVVKLQLEHEFSAVTDGQLQWPDLLRPIVESTQGMTVGALTRWFDNNTFFRRPVIDGEVRLREFEPSRFAFRDILPNEKPWRVILPSPYTFLKLSENAWYSDETILLEQLSKIIREICVQLIRHGFGQIQLNEPYLAFNKPAKDELALATSAIANVAKGLGRDVQLYCYFGDVSAILDNLLYLPVSGIGIDLYSTDISQLERRDFNKTLLCGCVDARNSLIENVDDVVRAVGLVSKKLSPRKIALCTNCDLEFLPRPVAEKKLAVLSEVARRLAS